MTNDSENYSEYVLSTVSSNPKIYVEEITDRNNITKIKTYDTFLNLTKTETNISGTSVGKQMEYNELNQITSVKDFVGTTTTKENTYEYEKYIIQDIDKTYSRLKKQIDAAGNETVYGYYDVIQNGEYIFDTTDSIELISLVKTITSRKMSEGSLVDFATTTINYDSSYNC